MLLSQWYALAGAAFVLTLVWTVIQPDERVFLTAGLSTAGWALAMLTAPGLQTLTESGERVAAGSDVLAFVALVFALVSALAVMGYKTGHYPPEPAADEPFPADDD
jgi:hypothetical protein